MPDPSSSDDSSKRSETRRPVGLGVPEWNSTTHTGVPHEAAPSLTLPPASDFRTSLILPSLSRRFTILRNSAGEPLSASQIRERLAEQRSRGAANHVTEEEEDLMIQALEQMRNASASASASDGHHQQHDLSRSYLSDSEPHTPPTRTRNFSNSSSTTVSPSHHSNSNSKAALALDGGSASLFSSSSSRLRDERQFRLAAKSSDRSLHSLGGLSSPTATSTPPRARDGVSSSSDVFQPSSSSFTLPDSNGSILPIDEKPEEQASAVVDAAFIEGGQNAVEVTPATVRRASAALAQALRDLEREMGLLHGEESTSSTHAQEPSAIEPDDEDTVLAPYTALPPKPSPSSLANNTSSRPRFGPDRDPPSFSGSHRSQASVASIASASDHEPTPNALRKLSASPVPRSEARVPGYVPGMHRPITPQGTSSAHQSSGSASASDLEDFTKPPSSPGISRSSASTPRAASPPSTSTSTMMGMGQMPISREAIHNSITRGLSGSLASRSGSGSPVPISRMFNNSSPGPSASSPFEKSPSPMSSPSHSHRESYSRRPSIPLSARESMNSRTADPPVSILRSRSPDQHANGNGANGRNGLGDDSQSMASMSLEASLQRARSNRSPALAEFARSNGSFGSPSGSGSGSRADRQHFSPPSARAVSPTPAVSAFGRQARSPTPPSPVYRRFNDPSTMSQPPPSASSFRSESTSPSPSPAPQMPVLGQGHTASSSIASTSSFFAYNRDYHSDRHHQTTPTPSSSHAHHPQSPSSRRAAHNPSPSAASATMSPSARTMMFSPMWNSSRSSLESVGSSYHSGEPEVGNLDAIWDYEDGLTDGTDVNGTGSEGTLVGGSIEELDKRLMKEMGLTRGDLVLIQNKLVDMARGGRGKQTKTTEVEPEAVLVKDAGSSEGHSSDAPADTVTYQPPSSKPPPSPVAPPQPISSTSSFERLVRKPSNASKADALLRSVMDSIASPSTTPPPAAGPSPTAPAPAVPSVAPPTPPSIPATPLPHGHTATSMERKKALTDALFGTLGSIKADSEARGSTENSPQAATSSSSSAAAAPPPQAVLKPVAFERSPSSNDQSRAQSRSHSHSSISSPSPSPELTAPAPSTPSLPKNNAESLVQDVQRQAAAATAALKSPSTPNFLEDASAANKRRSTKKIKPSYISSPMLMSSSTSVNAIPITSPSTLSLSGNLNHNASPSGPSKFSLKRLRGTLRSKPPPNGDEVTPWIDPTTPQSAQYAAYPSPTPLSHSTYPQSSSAASSSTPSAKDKISPDFRFPPTATQTPNRATPPPVVPASAPATVPRSAGFRGLMSRMRRAPRAGEDESPERGGGKPSTDLGRSLSAARREPAPPVQRVRPPDLFDPPSLSEPAALVRSPSERVPPPPEPTHVSAAPVPPASNPAPEDGDEAALQQLLEAASKLGYDQSAISDFLSRSGSISTTGRRSESKESGAVSGSAPRSDPKRSFETVTGDTSTPLPSPPPPVRSRPTPPNADAAANTVVRRTFYIASDAKLPDTLSNLPVRSSSLKRGHRRSTSVTSVQSGKSVVDRTPTPPPSKQARRKSQEASPPVPQLPSAYSHAARLSPTQTRSPRATVDLSTSQSSTSSMGDSGVGMSRLSSHPSRALTPGSMPPSGSGTALQMIEYANGQVVWSVVDGLRADAEADDWDLNDYLDDAASFDARRASNFSMASTVHSEAARKEEAMQLLFREHRRIASKESNSSYVSRRRALPPSQFERPETKVFYSSASEIENLIESISKGLDAGSFNVLPRMTPEPVPAVPPLGSLRGISKPRQI